jgi:hypothetical protein
MRPLRMDYEPGFIRHDEREDLISTTLGFVACHATHSV